MLGVVNDAVGNYAGLGAGTVLLLLVFRTLWKLSADASALSQNYDAALARAQADATYARTEAREAADSVAQAWLEVSRCERRSTELEGRLLAEVAELRGTIARLQAGGA